MARARLLAVPGADRLGEDQFRFLLGLASPGRQARAARFLRRQDACRAVVAEALLRHVVRGETGSEFEASRLRYNAYGKPSLPEPGVHFNLAHSGEWVVCGVDGEEIGVDIEAHHPMDFGVADRFFCREEKSLLDGIRAEAEHARTFFRIWSLKESYVKAIGKGFSCPLDSFACLPVPSREGVDVEFRPHGGGLPRKSFQLIDVHPEYACAVCLAREGVRMAPEFIRPEELIDSLRQQKENP